MKYLILCTFLFVNYFFGTSQKIKADAKQTNYLNSIRQLENQEQNFENLTRLADIYFQTGNQYKAIENYANALLLKEDTPIKLKLAEAYIRNDQKENAIQIYREIIRLQPENLLLKYRLANLFYKNKSFKKSLPLFTELHKKDSSNTNYTYKLASIYNYLKQYKKAIPLYKEVLVKNAKNYKSHYHLAKIYRKLKIKDSVNFYLKKGLEIKPYAVSLNQLQAKNAFQNKNYPTVIESVKRLDSIKTATPFYQNLLGISYYQTKKPEQAKAVFTKMLTKRQLQEDTFYYLGLTHVDLKDYKTAELYFNMSIYSKRPKIDKEYYQIAMLYKAQNNVKQAITFLKKSLEEKKYNANTLYELGVLTENYYKDKTIALKYYQEYISHFEALNPKRTKYILQQIGKIKTDLFMKKSN